MAEIRPSRPRAKKAQTENQNTSPELLQEATPLATFMLTHADTVERQRVSSSLNVSGVLTLTINRNCCCSDDKSEMMDPHSGRRSSPEFKLLPRIAKLKILLEGVYTEAGGGERVLCMVGNALLPMRGGGNTTEGPWDCAKNIGDGSNNFELPVVAHSTVPKGADIDNPGSARRDDEHERQVGQCVLRHCPAGFAARPCSSATTTSPVAVQGTCTKTSLSAISFVPTSMACSPSSPTGTATPPMSSAVDWDPL